MTRMVHALPREAHNLLSVLNMNYRDQLNSTKQTEGAETACACLEPGHTMMCLLGTSTISYYQEMAAAEQPTLFRPNGRAKRLYGKKTLSRTRSPITALRTFFGIAILVGSCALSVSSLAFSAEIFPYAPPSPSQQPSVEQSPTARLHTSKDKAEIKTFNHSWHIGNATFSKDLCKILKGDLSRTVFPTQKLDGDGGLWLVPV